MKNRFLLISFLVGFLSLGEEIVWVRVVSFLGHSVPQSFAFVLFFYIFGIALGALWGARLAKKGGLGLKIISFLLAGSGSVVVFSPLLINFLYGSLQFLIFVGFLIAIGAALKGAVFPLVHHWFSRPGEKLGRTLSWVYFANVLGSALGPLVVGFYFLDYFSMYSALAILGYAEIIMAVIVFMFVGRVRSIVLFCFAIFLFPLVSNSKDVLRQLVLSQHSPVSDVTNIIENKHGVIYTLRDDFKNADLVYGGNVYDGAFSIDLSSNVNGISRAYLLAGLHSDPKDVLFIGLSSGSWLRVVSAMPGVESIDVVEINPGYTELIQNYPGSSDIISDDRINIVYTDGRKWLNKSIREGRSYDLIVMNNTWHWRAYSTNLLSYEFMNMLRSVIAKNGVVTFNTTWSMDVFYTASQVFSGAYMYRNFVYASDHNLNETLEENGHRFCELDSSRLEGQSCQDVNFASVVDQLQKLHLLDWNEVPKDTLLGRPPEIITDDNMIVEYKYGKGLSIY
ncbi:hypothetical protein OQJ46_00175 [Microbulbifer thermotolerans]|uniref:spermine/spermidine synthase domain-containing protein n=1 Tax=Microbulbifer thermotolerans TaxID=252514 RepID=UPI00224B0C4F|nr:hypothetical protein [Microbulbifer thermotolerans]MCX2781402.1 hypothetical protein [Microbulbifer thermotolerans]